MMEFMNEQLDNLKGLNIVALGGGHGLGRLLSALSFVGQNLTGIVTTTDNGGSTGRLRQETGCIAWGDLRNCLSQLTEANDIKKLLFEYRFNDAGSLSGHSLGNLMLLALDNMCVRPIDTLTLFRQFLNVDCPILPMTENPVHLSAQLTSDTELQGEVEIDALKDLPQNITLTSNVDAPVEVIQAIKNADLILMGPGSFITSILPPLLIPAIKKSIEESSAPRILIANMVPENGPTGQLPLDEKIHWMEDVIGGNVVDSIIWPDSRPLNGGENLHVLLADLHDSSMDRIHNKEKLANIISKAYQQLSENKMLNNRLVG